MYFQKNGILVTMPGKKFDWDEATQGQVLGSFFYGYTLTNLLGGRLSEKYGGHRVYGLGVLFTAILTIISPLAAYYSTNAFLLIRVFEGMTEGVTFPAMNVLISKWIPPNERSRSMTRVMGGSPFGTVITLALSGWLCQSSLGWPSVFYGFGSLGLIWSYAWYNIIYESPEQNPHITSSELTIISQGTEENRKNRSAEVPWKSIFTSMPFIGVMVAHFGANWGFYNLLTELPTYLTNIQHFNLKDNGVVSSLPYFLMWSFSLFYSSWADDLLSRKKITLIQLRGISTAISFYIPMILFLMVTAVGCNAKLAVAVICLAMGLTGASYSGFHCAFQELAPNYSGTLTGISNTVATIPGFLAPGVTGYIINNEQTLSNWSKVFHLSSFIYLASCTFYLIFMSVEVQSWNSKKIKTSEEEEQTCKVPLIDSDSTDSQVL